MSTPLMRQYHEIKQQFSDALVLFQVGDFYELFFDDARKAATFLGIALTKRGYHEGEPIPLCGVPLHTKDHYITKLIKGGFRVVLVDQLTPAIPGKIVERGVSCVLTPGTLTQTNLLSDKNASYCAALVYDGAMLGISFCELLTGQVLITTIPVEDMVSLEAELARFKPAEIIIAESTTLAVQQQLKKWGYALSPLASSALISWESIRDNIAEKMPAFILQSTLAQHTIALLFSYLRKIQYSIDHFDSFVYYAPHDGMVMDACTIRHLELIENMYDQSGQHTLCEVLDHCGTSMGSRLLKKWLMRPLLTLPAIEQRQAMVRFFQENQALATSIREHIQRIGDIERLVGRLMLKRAQFADYRMLVRSLESVVELIMVLAPYQDQALMPAVIQNRAQYQNLYEYLKKRISLEDDTQWIIAAGYDDTLDHMRALNSSEVQHIIALERREIERTGISSLKIKYNQIQGYAFEITKANSHLVPADFQLIQNLVNRDRYSTPELKKLEQDLLQAQQRMKSYEQELFVHIETTVFNACALLRVAAQHVAHLDVLLSFAQLANQEGYCIPRVHHDRMLTIEQGKHPVVAQLLKHEYIANDVMLTQEHSMWIITGPNMGGKSTLMRQVALSAIMAQIGAPIPAQRASMPLFDQLFTRIGASDQVARRKSTFFLEMEETARICARATRTSLVILDEIGRGTSTYDGIALARAIAEFIAQRNIFCLFATHYHELAQLAQQVSCIQAYHAASKATEQGVILMHKIVPGVSEGSFGIQVAREALVPPAIIERAQELLQELSTAPTPKPTPRAQQHMLVAEHPVIHHLKQLNCEELSAKQALDLLWSYKAQL